jgi:hypothetical protein
MDTTNAIGTLACVVLGLPAFYLVHRGINRCCLAYARRYCRRHNLSISSTRSAPEIGKSGFKTENTIIELDCTDSDQTRQLVRLVVWLFGIREASTRPFIASDEDRFP